jgi:uncharacterized phage protein gp47/JayE
LESYESILERMRRTYTEKSGWVPEEVSDTGLKLQVLAGELYRLQARVEWLKRQAFPQTADGAQLDLHGAQRGVVRREAQRAAGTLSFCRYIPLSFDLVIPKGTVCASYGEEAVEYETIQEGVLAPGEVAVDIPAQAVEGGAKGNAAASYINTLVSEVNGVNYVVNTAAFTGGLDPEEDEAYRERILESYRLAGQTGSAVWYEALALEQEGVGSAQAVPREEGPGTVAVYVWGDGAAPAAGVLSGLTEKLNQEREVGVTVTVKAAAVKKIGVMGFLEVRPGAVFDQARDRALAAVTAWFARRKIGDPVYLGDLSRVILEADPAISQVTFNTATKAHAATAGVLPTLGGAILSEAS